jgi:hypothetical protein
MSNFKSFAVASLLAGLAMVAVPAVAQQAAPAAKPAKAVAAPRLRVEDLQRALVQEGQRSDAAMKEVERLREELKIRDELVALGIKRNAELYAIMQEVIAKGIVTSSWEPFLQLRRVEMENLKQSYEDRIRASRILETTLAPSVETRMQEELARSKAKDEPAPPQ